MTTSPVHQVRNHLKRIGSKEIAAHSQRFFKTGKGEYGEGDVFLGVRVPVLRKLVKQYRGLKIHEVAQLIQSPFHEERLLALLMLVDMFFSAGAKDKRSIYDLYLASVDYINNWDLVDCSAEHIVGGYLENRDKKPIHSLARSEDLWERRIAMMATFRFIKKNEFVDALHVADLLLHDTEDLIHKAVGWMLREIGKRDRIIEEEFLKHTYQNMPRTMLRYAIERFPEHKRQRYLKGII